MIRKAADVALADVADGDNGGGGLQLLQNFLEAVESGDPSKDEVVSLGELVCFCKGCDADGLTSLPARATVAIGILLHQEPELPLSSELF